MQKLTFKEYYDSKERLREAAKTTPKQSLTYDVKKYCNLIVGESSNKEYIALKPKNNVSVQWLYEDLENPSVLSVTVDGVEEIDPNTHHAVFWEGERFQRWLERNTKEKF